MAERFTAFRISEAEETVTAGFVECSLDDLDPGDVVVRVAYSDVNYKDALAATGKGRILRRKSCIGGIDLAGTVVTSANPSLSPGDEVCAAGFGLGVSHDGGYSQFARVPGEWLTKLPSTLRTWESMALGTAGLTVALAITRMEANGLEPANGPVIVSGATGGVGSIAVAALAGLGYHVVALTGKADQADWLRQLGAKEVLLRSALDLTPSRPLGKTTWAGAIDTLGGDVLAWMASTMKIRGVIAAVGLAASPTLHTTVLPFILRGVSLLGISSSDGPTQEMRAAAWRRLATDLKPPLLQTMSRTIPFSDLPRVFDDFIAGAVSRRIVVDLSR
ncbi:MAG: acryloyl-CoA reductase [Acidobacteria bacterium]|nr:acryloyl-CoA reductase [Acidobacteriota bacterium]